MKYSLQGRQGKRLITGLAILAASASLVCGCDEDQLQNVNLNTEDGVAKAQEQDKDHRYRLIGMANPMHPVESHDEFTRINVRLEEPVNATKPEYFIIGDTLAQINFELDGMNYCYRAAHTYHDIAGIYMEAIEQDSYSIDAPVEDPRLVEATEMTISRYPEGWYAARWKWHSLSFSLLSQNPTDMAAFVRTAKQLAKDSWQ